MKAPFGAEVHGLVTARQQVTDAQKRAAPPDEKAMVAKAAALMGTTMAGFVR